MIWLWTLLLTTVLLVALVWLGRVPPASRTLVAAALMLGLAGYALTGVPGLPASEVAARPADEGFGEAIEANQGELRDRFGKAGMWLGLADRLSSRGKHALAIKSLQSGLKLHPDNVDLWVALGNTLVAHGGDRMNPAAALAFDEAVKASPDHPAPPFFAGLALARGGDLEGAEAVWAELLARSPADAPWRADLEGRLGQLRAMRPATGAALQTAPQAR